MRTRQRPAGTGRVSYVSLGGEPTINVAGGGGLFGAG